MKEKDPRAYNANRIIKKLRQDSGMSLEEFALQVGVATQSVWNWETFKTIPRCDNFERIINAVGGKIIIRLDGAEKE